MCTGKRMCEMFNMTGVKGSWSEINLAHTLYKLKRWARHINGPIVISCAHVT